MHFKFNHTLEKLMYMTQHLMTTSGAPSCGTEYTPMATVNSHCSHLWYHSSPQIQGLHTLNTDFLLLFDTL